MPLWARSVGSSAFSVGWRAVGLTYVCAEGTAVPPVTNADCRTGAATVKGTRLCEEEV